MSEFFIVLSRKPDEFDTLPEALIQQRKLERHVPGVEHTIYRCKRWLSGARHFPKMYELLSDIVRDGLTPQNLERARIVLFTIGYRTPKLKTLTRVDGPPEFGAGEGAP